MAGLRLAVAVEKLPFSAPFRIAGRVFEHQDAVVVTLDDGVSFFKWAHEHWPAPRWSVELDPWQLSPDRPR